MNIQTKRVCMALLMSMICLFGFAQKTIHGTVKDTGGEPMIGVTVSVDGKAGAVTDFDGNFELKNVSDKSQLKISYIGYVTQTLTVGGKSEFSIVMEEDAQTLEDVVVVGYGTMKKSDLTGSIASVGTEELNAKGAPSLMENLQGTTPGVNITQSSGRAGGDFNIEIRGRSSINSSTKPIYVVDGVICDDIQFLNPQDVERIDVLKDASSTAIYGSRATAGVIMVTTKGGLSVKKDSKPTISYDGYYGVTKAARMPDFMNGDQFYRYRFSKFLMPTQNYDGPQPAYGFLTPAKMGQALIQQDVNDLSSPYILKEMLANGETYDWPDLVTNDGQQQNHFLSVNGSSERVNYHFGVGYNQEKGLYEGDEMQRFNFKGSLDAKITNVISAGFNINVAYIDNSYADDGAIQNAYRVNPFMRPYDKDGNIIHFPGNKTTFGTNDNQFSDFVSPLDRMRNATHKRETWRLLGNVYLKFDILKGLDFKTTFSPNYTNYRDGQFTGYINPDTGLTYEDKDPSTNSAIVTNSKGISYTWDNVINYNTTIAEDHSLGFMGLFSMVHDNSEKYTWSATGVLENTDWWNMNSGTFVQEGDNPSSTGYGEKSMISYALRANYAYKNKYLFTGTVRWDGSSKFAEDNRWGCFPSMALAWRITEENFMKKIDWLSNLKLRLSYGITGNNDGVGNFATVQTIGNSVSYPFGSAYVPGFQPGTIVDKDIKWETSHEFNVGLDFGFLNNRINGSIDFYNKESKDLLYNVSLPLEAGGISMYTNIGKVQNRGIEIALNTVNIQNSDWNWTTSFMFAHNKNKVKQINGVSDQYLNGDDVNGNLFVGYYANNIYTYVTDGIVSDRNMIVPNHQIAIDKGLTPGSTMRECDYYYTCYGLTEGQPIVRDVNGDGSIGTEDKLIFSKDPVWTGSFTSNLSYKNWDLSMSLYAKINYKVSSSFMGGDYYDYHDRGRGKMYMDYYIPAGALIDADGINPDGTYINPVYQTETHYGSYPFPNEGANDGVGPFKSQYDIAKSVVNASYVKIKNITLGYTFPTKWVNAFGCKYLRLYATVTNPFVFTKYKGFDPEWADASEKYDGPSTVTYQIGASIKF